MNTQENFEQHNFGQESYRQEVGSWEANMAHRKPKNVEENAAEHLEMRIPARAEWVRVVRLATAGVASRAGFAYDDIEDIKLAVAEACNNAILHSAALDTKSGNESGAAGSTPVVTIRWRLLGNGIRISVSDEGRLAPPGLVPRAESTPAGVDASPLEELPESGMGLLLIESLMDEVEHESGLDADTTIHMTKRVAPQVNRSQESEGTARPDPDAPVALGSRPANSASSARRTTPPRVQR